MASLDTGTLTLTVAEWLMKTASHLDKIKERWTDDKVQQSVGSGVAARMNRFERGTLVTVGTRTFPQTAVNKYAHSIFNEIQGDIDVDQFKSDWKDFKTGFRNDEKLPEESAVTGNQYTASIKQWARQKPLDEKYVDAILQALKRRAASSSLREKSTIRLTSLPVAHLELLLTSLPCLVVADFSVVELVVGAMAVKQAASGDVLRNLAGATGEQAMFSGIFTGLAENTQQQQGMFSGIYTRLTENTQGQLAASAPAIMEQDLLSGIYTPLTENTQRHHAGTASGYSADGQLSGIFTKMTLHPNRPESTDGGQTVTGTTSSTVPRNQPADGCMAMFYSKHESLSGYPHTGSYTIQYDFPGGIQGANHPNPGQRYEAITREAYLPDTDEGRKVLMLLKTAFDRRLVFTMGKSITTDKDGIVWSGIVHKSSRTSGQYGFPDPQYLEAVKKTLKERGVTENDLTDLQWDFIYGHPHEYVCQDPKVDFSHRFGSTRTH